MYLKYFLRLVCLITTTQSVIYRGSCPNPPFDLVPLEALLDSMWHLHLLLPDTSGTRLPFFRPLTASQTQIITFNYPYMDSFQSEPTTCLFIVGNLTKVGGGTYLQFMYQVKNNVGIGHRAETTTCFKNHVFLEDFRVNQVRNNLFIWKCTEDWVGANPEKPPSFDMKMMVLSKSFSMMPSMKVINGLFNVTHFDWIVIYKEPEYNEEVKCSTFDCPNETSTSVLIDKWYIFVIPFIILLLPVLSAFKNDRRAKAAVAPLPS